MNQNGDISIQSDVINKAISYIFENLDEKLTVDEVADYCGYSKFHLMRLFKEYTGEAIYQFIKRIRLERSAWRLKVEKDKSVTEIGEDYGYSSSNFATAFKKHLDVSPEKFRERSEKLVEQSSFAHGVLIDEIEGNEEKITVEELPGFFVIYERRKGNYHNMSEEWCKFVEKYRNFVTDDTLYIECTIDDPSITDENQCMYELCQTIRPDSPALKDAEFLTQTFDAGKYAVYHFKGFPQLMYIVYQEIFCRWLSRTNNHLDERPILDIYRKIGDDGYMEIDICFPLR